MGNIILKRKGLNGDSFLFSVWEVRITLNNTFIYLVCTYFLALLQ